MLRRCWLVMLCLLASSLVATTTVHAREALTTAEISCGGDVHVAGDSDEAPADQDRAAPHQHGTCHGHAFAIGSDAVTPARHAVRSGEAVSRRAPGLASLSIDPALKPPRS